MNIFSGNLNYKLCLPEIPLDTLLRADQVHQLQMAKKQQAIKKM